MQKSGEVTTSEEIHTSEANASGVNTPTQEYTPKHRISTATSHSHLRYLMELKIFFSISI
jgi:hypothetical protein